MIGSSGRVDRVFDTTRAERAHRPLPSRPGSILPRQRWVATVVAPGIPWRAVTSVCCTRAVPKVRSTTRRAWRNVPWRPGLKEFLHHENNGANS